MAAAVKPPESAARTSASASRFRWHSALFRAMAWRCRGTLRIIVYHGVCGDHERYEPWIPAHFVTQSQLDEHLALIRRYGTLIDLREAVETLAAGRAWRQALAAVTFDDAHANLLRWAVPVLDAHAARATVFAVTDRLEDGGLLPGDARRVAIAADTRHAREAMRHMTWAEAEKWSHSGHVVGAHTCSHAILSRLDPAARQREIADSLHALRARFGTHDIPFAYPNGQADDFDESDVRLLRDLEVPIACTGIAGANRPPLDVLRLHRNGVGLHHGRNGFAAELLGLRDRRHAREHEAKQRAQREAVARDMPRVETLDPATRSRAAACFARMGFEPRIASEQPPARSTSTEPG